MKRHRDDRDKAPRTRGGPFASRLDFPDFTPRILDRLESDREEISAKLMVDRSLRKKEVKKM